MDRQAGQGQQAVLRAGSTPPACTSSRISRPRSQGKTGLGIYPDGMVEHDGHVGQLLKKLDDLGIVDNTIVVYATDNGAEVMSPGRTVARRRYRGEKATNWEGGYRTCRCSIRWPGCDQARAQSINDFFAHEDFIPTFCRRGRRSRCRGQGAAKGYQCGGKTFKVHLDGYNLMPFFKGEVKESPRKEFLYWSDDGDLFAVRYRPVEDYLHRAIPHGIPRRLEKGQFSALRMPNLYNLRADPFERGPESACLRLATGSLTAAFVIVPDASVRRKVAARASRNFRSAPETRELQPRRRDAEAIRKAGS